MFKLQFLPFLLCLACTRFDSNIVYSDVSQVNAEQEVLVRNSVKSITEKHCFPNQEGYCTVISQTVDRNGNITGYHMHRMGSRYEYEYDEYNRLISEYRISGDNIERIEYVYNDRGDLIEIIGKGFHKTYRNFYDHRARLIKQIEDYVNYKGEEVRTIVVKDWSSSDELLKESSYTTCDGDHVNTRFPMHTKRIEYNKAGQPITEIQMEGNRVVNDIQYNYRDNGALWASIQFDLSDSGYVTESGFKMDNKQTRIEYAENGLIREEYMFVSDPCMSLENHFLFRYFYDERGLRTRADVYEEGDLSFQITYEYEFW
jgi:YD repeat-containing protein